MRTTISLPEQLFKAVEALAEHLGISRSRLYALALDEYIARHFEKRVTARLDGVYSKELSSIDSAVAKAQTRAMKSADW